MKKTAMFLSVGLLAASLAFAAETTGPAAPEITGRVRLFSSFYAADNPDGAFFTHKAGQFAFRRAEVRLKLSGAVNDRVSYGVRFDAFSYPGDLLQAGQFPESAFLGSPASSEHFELALYEGWVKVGDFLIEGLDLTAGKQRISWGTADKIGVVDNLNPIDFANFLSFDPDYFFERRPQTAVNLEYYPGGSFKIQLVGLLQHQVSPLPFGYSGLVAKFFPMDEYLVTRGWDDTAVKTAWGARVAGRAAGLDLGVSYYRGNLTLPYLRSMDAGLVASGVFYYPRAGILGLDLAGEAGGLGYWAEAAYVMPEKIDGSVSFPIWIGDGPVIYTKTFPLFEEGFWKYVAGADYNFGGGFSVNIQFLHGFFDEVDYNAGAEDTFGFRKGMFFGEPGNYVLGRAEYKFARDTVKLKFGGLFETTSNGSAFVIMPEAEFRVADAFNVVCGAFAAVSGDREKTKFGAFRDDGQIYLGFKLDF
ncbi:MAG: hypothetical protein PHF93_09175 [Acidobacteriota bacterium]|nr:hypothetical protein [Acidobacteriota bacterium]OQB56254.1 MAG: hypothetical protein BWX98_01869 [Candidatus Aminicenantes bacterium ADurb.Bin147]HNQ79466.1 hypothetical protein [Candidatus Aminicenantes bacterium]MDD8033979.1 hypothetical protein [Acidobacteriota bacterium]MDD8039919.1 hypothetical protein [Acidobacteriota bacterium]